MIRRMKTENAKAVAKIHMEALDIGFLSNFGKKFLSILYEGISQSEYGFGFVSYENSQIVGFVTGASSTKTLMQDVYRKNKWKFLKAVFFKVLRRPGTIRMISQSLHYSDVAHDKVEAELLSIAIKEDFKNKGMGKQLVLTLIQHFSEIGIPKFKVSVDQRLKGADKFYKALGFTHEGEIEIFKRKLDIYMFEMDGET